MFVCIEGSCEEYLTPLYANATYSKGLNVKALEGQNLLFQNLLPGLFRSVFKSYVLNTGMVRVHRTLSGFEVMQSYLDREDGGAGYLKLFDLDFLVLYLVGDPNNREYSAVLCSLLEGRKSRGRNTWVYAGGDVKSEWFRGLYGVGLSDYLSGVGGRGGDFKELKLTDTGGGK